MSGNRWIVKPDSIAGKQLTTSLYGMGKFIIPFQFATYLLVICSHKHPAFDSLGSIIGSPSDSVRYQSLHLLPYSLPKALAFSTILLLLGYVWERVFGNVSRMSRQPPQYIVSTGVWHTYFTKAPQAFIDEGLNALYNSMHFLPTLTSVQQC